MAEAMQWLRSYEQFWSGKLGALEAALAASRSPAASSGEPHE
jgi:hypothetical protein